ncbi:MAG: 6-bladed beta-propeller [Elusimicrobiales bacterium]|nr:6-bladed beta-propeller [Elusimicrobiales bacterium]
MKLNFIFSAVFFLLAGAAGAYEKIEFKTQFLSPAFLKPAAVAVAGGKTFVADSKANAVFVFDADGKQIKKLEGGLKGPEALAFGNDRLYVADTGNSRIVVFDAEGKALWAFSGDGSAPGQLSGPRGLAYGPDNRLYVSNTRNSRVDVFNADGIYLYGFAAAKTDGITKLNPAKISLDRSGDILVADPDKALLQKYDRTGKLLKEYAVANNGAVTDKRGLLYLINSKEGKVTELSAAGEKIATFGTKGKGKMEFKNLRDIAIDGAGTIYLCDDENKKVVAIGLESSETGPELPLAAVLDRFTVKGPAAKAAFKAEVFAVTPDNKIVAYMPEAREIVLLDNGTKKTLVREGKLQGQVRAPKGIYVDQKGLIYVADTGNDRVQIFNPDGTFNNMFGESGSGDGQFKSPSSVAVNAKGNIYVADTRNRKVKAFSPDGMFLFSVGPEAGNLILASPVAVRCDENKNVYVLDSALKKVIVLDAMGKFLRIWDESGALQDPASLSYDEKGFFYILDRGTYNVKIFDADGKFTASFFAKGRGERELWAPQHMAFRNDKIYISDLENARILAFDISYLPEEPFDLKAEAGEKSVKLSWKARSNAWTGGARILRRKGADGELKEVGSVKEKTFEDLSVSPDSTYSYYAAGLSVTGVQGGLSAPAEVYYKGPETPVEAPAAEADNRNVAPMEILPVELNYIFSANYKYYQKNPVGRIAVKNNTDSDFSNVKLSFFFKDFMDFPSDTVVPLVKARSQAEVDLSATLNNRVLNITEDTPIQCQLTLTYYQDGAEKTFTLNKPVKVLSKNAIVWDKPQRLANFITPKDTPVFAFSRFALNEKGKFEDETSFLNENTLTALMVWEALGEQGLSYLADPVSPYAVLKSSKEVVLDTVQFPRSTLKLKSGDCDDLTALFASIFEASGVKAALLDYPAHIALMFDTGSSDAREVGIPEEYLIKYNNTWWVGLETTMVGKDFYDAVKHEADLYRRSKDEVRVIDVRGAWAEFEPVTLPEGGDEPQPDKAKFTARVKEAAAALLKARYDYFKDYFGKILAENPGDVDANLNLGMLTARNGEGAAAMKYFNDVLAKEPFNSAALNNLGNVAFGDKKYEEAKKYYFDAAKADPYDAEIWLNLARVSDKLGRKDDVKTFADRAAKIDPAVKSVGDKLLK